MLVVHKLILPCLFLTAMGAGTSEAICEAGKDACSATPTNEKKGTAMLQKAIQPASYKEKQFSNAREACAGPRDRSINNPKSLCDSYRECRSVASGLSLLSEKIDYDYSEEQPYMEKYFQWYYHELTPEEEKYHRALQKCADDAQADFKDRHGYDHIRIAGKGYTVLDYCC